MPYSQSFGRVPQRPETRRIPGQIPQNRNTAKFNHPNSHTVSGPGFSSSPTPWGCETHRTRVSLLTLRHDALAHVTHTVSRHCITTPSHTHYYSLLHFAFAGIPTRDTWVAAAPELRLRVQSTSSCGRISLSLSLKPSCGSFTE